MDDRTTHDRLDDSEPSDGTELVQRLSSCRVELVHPAVDRAEAASKARLTNQPMSSNFDGNCH
jgi:hypothetical protein